MERKCFKLIQREYQQVIKVQTDFVYELKNKKWEYGLDTGEEHDEYGHEEWEEEKTVSKAAGAAAKKNAPKVPGSKKSKEQAAIDNKPAIFFGGQAALKSEQQQEIEALEKVNFEKYVCCNQHKIKIAI